MSENMTGQKIFNDVVDEAYELEDGEDMIEEKKIEN